MSGAGEFYRAGTGDTAVLFIHGILGTPRHFDSFLPRVPEDWAVHCLLLDGHGAGVREFSRSSMAAWEEQVENAVRRLAAEHSRVLLVGHSLGTLLAMEQAVLHPEQVAGIFLLAAPLRLALRPRLVPQLIRVWLNKPKAEDPVSQAFAEACGVRQDWRIWRYLGWLPRFWELLIKIRKTRKLLPQLRVPCLAFQSRRDEMVSLRACEDLKACAKVAVLEDSGHFYYTPEDRALFLKDFVWFCQNCGY